MIRYGLSKIIDLIIEMLPISNHILCISGYLIIQGLYFLSLFRELFIMRNIKILIKVINENIFLLFDFSNFFY